MSQPTCPFCSPSDERVFHKSDLALGLWDAYPVSKGHALLIPLRHVANWFDATREEQAALLAAAERARELIETRHKPDGYNLGINVGAPAGQTVFHLHVHLIPRYSGDVPDPRGGVRHVIPGRGNYLAAELVKDQGDGEPPSQFRIPGPTSDNFERAIITGEDDHLLPHLTASLASATRADIAAAFLTQGGLLLIEPHLRDLLDRKGTLRILTGDYLGFTEPAALRHLLDFRGAIERRVFETSPGGTRPWEVSTGRNFHPKAYILHDRDGGGIAFVGSSNLTRSALREGLEWNYRVRATRDRRGFNDVASAFESVFHHPATKELTDEWIDAYETRRPAASSRPPVPVDIDPETPPEVPKAHSIQRTALEALESTRRAGNQAGLVVLATGLGKTWLSAFDSNRPEYPRVLFVAHREEILDQSLQTFRKIRPNAHLGQFTGKTKDNRADVLFASIQTLSRKEHLEMFAPDHFDYVVIDEFHHAAARSYRKLIDYFRPAFLLGLTATPERTDGGDLLALCGENLVYRCDLVDGIRAELLSPFHYFGVPDIVDYRNIPWRSTRFDEEALTRAVATQARAENALEQYRRLAGKRTLALVAALDCKSQSSDGLEKVLLLKNRLKPSNRFRSKLKGLALLALELSG